VNHRYGHRLCLAITILLLALSSAALQAKTWVKELAPGVTYIQIVRTPEEGGVPRIINALKIDPKTPGVEIRSVLAHDQVNGLDPTRGRETMGSIAKRLKATAVINTDFCNWTGDPLGLHIEKGELVSEPYPRRTMFGITADGKHLYDVLGWSAKVTLPDGKSRDINGIDRDRGGGELIAYTRKWFPSTCTKDNGSEAVITTTDLPVRIGVPIKGKVTALRPNLGDTPIPEDGIVLSGGGVAGGFIANNLEEGMEVTLTFNVIPTSTTGWENVVEAAGGAPRLLRNGEICANFEQEGVSTSHCTITHPRSALGSTADGRLVLVTVDGRQYNATGMAMTDLAKLMKEFECVDALSLDGGGSTTMATYFGILNSPSDGKLRPLPNGIAVFAPESSFSAPEFKVVAPVDSIMTGESMQLSLVDAATGKPLDQQTADRAIWSTAAAMGFVDQSGKFTGYGAGKVEIVVKLGSRLASTIIETLPGPPQKLLASLEKDNPDTTNRSVVVITVTDKNWNRLKGVTVKVKGARCTPDSAQGVTGEDGKVSIGITWDGASGGQVEVTSGSLKPVVVKQGGK